MKNKNILYIQTKEITEFVFKLKTNDNFYISKNSCKQGKLSEILLQSIDKFIKESNLILQDLDAIVVFSGPGSYTSLRIGVVTANSLAWGLNIEVIGISGKVLFEKVVDKLKNTAKKQFDKPVDVHYQQ